MDIPSLEEFKAKLNGALRNLVQWKESLPMAGVLEQDGIYDSFQTKILYDSVTVHGFDPIPKL